MCIKDCIGNNITNLKNPNATLNYSYNPWSHEDQWSSSYIIRIIIKNKKYYLIDNENNTTTWHSDKAKAKRFFTINQVEVYITQHLKNRNDAEIVQI